MAVVKQINRYQRKDLPKRNVEVAHKTTTEAFLENLKTEDIEKMISASTKNKKTKKSKDMSNEKITIAEDILEKFNSPENVKVVKKDRGLIERTESSKIVLTEDNRQVLND